MTEMEKMRRYAAGFDRVELRAEDIEGKTPEEIEELKAKLAVYLEEKELFKVEAKRLRADHAQYKDGTGSDRTEIEEWFGYYQRQILDRIEHVNENRPTNPLQQEPISNKLHPMGFYAEEFKPQDFKRM